MKQAIMRLLLVVVCLLLPACGQQIPAESAKTNWTMTWQEQYDLGMRYLVEENYAEAIIAFTAAIEIDPKQAEAYVGRADAYIRSAESMSNAERDEYYEKALQDYLKALDLGYSDAEITEKTAQAYFLNGKVEQGLALLDENREVTGDVTREPFLTSVGTEVFELPNDAYGFIHGQIADVNCDGMAEYVSLYSTLDGLEVRVAKVGQAGKLSENKVGIVGKVGYCDACDVVLFYSVKLGFWCIGVEDIPEGAYTGVNGFTSTLYLLSDSEIKRWNEWDWNTFTGSWDDLDDIWESMKSVGWPASRYWRMVPAGEYNKNGNCGAAWLSRTEVELIDSEYPTEVKRYVHFLNREQLEQLKNGFGAFEIYPSKIVAKDAQDAPETNLDALDQITYLGDLSACRMSQATALAYANVVANWPAESEWFGSSGAALVDAGEDGYPLLLVGNSYYDTEINYLVGSGCLYEYQDGTASQIPSPYSYALGKLDGKPAVLAYDQGTGAVEFPYRYHFLTVSDGKTKLVHEVVVEDQYTISLDGTRYNVEMNSRDAYFASLGWVEQRHIGPDGGMDEIEAEFTPAAQFVDALLTYANADTSFLTEDTWKQNPTNAVGNEPEIPEGSPAVYIGKTPDEIAEILGCPYQTDWLEGQLAYYEVLPGVWFSYDTVYAINGGNDVRGFYTQSDTDLYGDLHGHMTYGELTTALSGIVSLEEPKWDDYIFEGYYVVFIYGSYEFCYYWTSGELPENAKSTVVWVGII